MAQPITSSTSTSTKTVSTSLMQKTAQTAKQARKRLLQKAKSMRAISRSSVKLHTSHESPKTAISSTNTSASTSTPSGKPSQESGTPDRSKSADCWCSDNGTNVKQCDDYNDNNKYRNSYGELSVNASPRCGKRLVPSKESVALRVSSCQLQQKRQPQSRPCLSRAQSQPALLCEQQTPTSSPTGTKSRPTIIHAFESFNESQRSLCSKTESVAPRKPARRLSQHNNGATSKRAGDIGDQNIHDEEDDNDDDNDNHNIDNTNIMIESFEAFNHSQRSLCAKTERRSPRKPGRRLSTDHEELNHCRRNNTTSNNKKKPTAEDADSPKRDGRPTLTKKTKNKNTASTENSTSNTNKRTKTMMIDAFESFNQSQRSLCSKNEVSSPRKPGRRLSRNDIVDREDLPMLDRNVSEESPISRSLSVNTNANMYHPNTTLPCNEGFSIMQKPQGSSQSNVGPRKPTRYLSQDSSMPCFVLLQSDDTLPDMEMEPTNKASDNVNNKTQCMHVKRADENKTHKIPSRMPMIQAFDEFNHSQRSLSSKTELKCPRKPARRLSRENSMPILFTASPFDVQETTTTRLVRSPRKPGRRLSREMSVPLLICTGGLQGKDLETNKVDLFSPRLPKRRLSRDMSMPCLFHKQKESQSLPQSPRKPKRQMSRDNPLPCFVSKNFKVPTGKDAGLASSDVDSLIVPTKHNFTSSILASPGKDDLANAYNSGVKNEQRSSPSKNKCRKLSRENSMPMLSAFQPASSSSTVSPQPMPVWPHSPTRPSPPRETKEVNKRKENPPIIDTFEAFNESQRSLCSKTEVSSPRKPARWLSSDACMQVLQSLNPSKKVRSPRKEKKCFASSFVSKPALTRAGSVPILQTFGSFNVSQVTLESVSEEGPTKPKRTVSCDSSSMLPSMESFSMDDSISSLDLESLAANPIESTPRSFPRAESLPAIRFYNDFNDSQLSLSSVSERLPRQRPSTICNRTRTADASIKNDALCSQEILTPAY